MLVYPRLLLILFYSFLISSEHLLFNRITIAPDNAEFVSIFNPTDSNIDLSNYYITDSVIDDNLYYNLPTGSNFWSESISSTTTDFIARFPSINIAPNDSLVLSLHTQALFESYYGYQPDISLMEDMIDLDQEGTISCNWNPNCPEESDLLHDNSEVLILFHWDGFSQTVKDVDYFLWGGDNHAINKAGINGYENDTVIDEQDFIYAHGNDSTYIRVDLNEGAENHSNGNGITGHDETSENLSQTWVVSKSLEFGCTNFNASNYNSNATIDDGSCITPESEVSIDEIINNCGQDAGNSLECDGQYNLSSESASQCPLYENQVTTSGVIVDYFDITPFNGPHSFTLQDSEGRQIDFVVWPESSQYQDGFDITEHLTLGDLTQDPFSRFEVQITGELGAYCDDDELLDINSEWQITVEYDYNLVILDEYNIEDLGCTDSDATNYNENALIDDGSCTYPSVELSINDIINNCGGAEGELLVCDGQYDLSSQSASQCPLYENQVTTSGVIVDYFDITPFNGPHSFTIEDNQGKRIDFVIWPESSSYQDGFDITTHPTLASLLEPPFEKFNIQIIGELGAYCDDDQLLDINSEWQITVEYDYNIVVLEEYNYEGYFIEQHNVVAKIEPSPYILIPTLGEKLDFSYSHPANSRVLIRIYDLSGRFITSLVDKYVENSGTWYNGVNPNNGSDASSSSWDGRDHLGQILAAGTYLIHLETYNFSTGKTQKDIAPIVIGVSP